MVANESDQPISATVIPGEPLPAAEEAPTLFAGKLIFWIPIVPLIALDLWSKTWAFALVTGKNAGQFSSQNDVAVFELSWVRFELVTWLNRGTIWGLGDQFHDYLKFLRVGAIALILYFVYKTASKHRWMLLALGLMIGLVLPGLFNGWSIWQASKLIDSPAQMCRLIEREYGRNDCQLPESERELGLRVIAHEDRP